MKRKPTRSHSESTPSRPATLPVRIDASRRNDLLRVFVSAADGVRDQPWPSASRDKALQEAVPYDRHGAAKAMVRLDDFPLDAKNRKILKAHIDALAEHLPQSLEDLDGNDVFEWLERELPIEWVDDQLGLPETEKAALISLIEATLANREPGTMPQEIGRNLARSIGDRIAFSTGTETTEAQVKLVERFLVEFLIAWLWQATGIEHTVAERALAGVAKVLRVRWIAPPRPERVYSASEGFNIGDILLHPKFGRGTVTSRTDTSIEVQFADGARKLGSKRSHEEPAAPPPMSRP